MCDRSLTEKLSKAIEDNALIERIGGKIHEMIPIYMVKDKSLAISVKEVDHYLSLEKKYLPIIRSMKYDAAWMEESDYIWVCWFQGLENAPDLVKVCVHSIQQNFPEKKVVVLTDRNIRDYIQLPEFIEKKRKKNIIHAAQYSDLIRVALLCEYGGLWVDATVYCTGREQYEEFEGTDLFVYRKMDEQYSKKPIICSNWMIYAKKNNPILTQTRDILWIYWNQENRMKDYFIFHMFLAMIAKEHMEDWNKIPMFNNVSPHVLQTELNNQFSKKRWEQLQKISSFHKLNHHVSYDSTEDTVYSYILNRDRDYGEKE